MGLGPFFYIILFFSSIAAAVPEERELKALFQKHFFSHYTEGKCGLNTRAFAEALSDVDGLYFVTIENKGFSVFGMVNAEEARGERFLKPANVERNWYHHVILMDNSGKVYDFDFTTAPVVIPMEKYLEAMFLNEPECDSPVYGEFCGGRKAKLEDYQFEATSAALVLAKERSPKTRRAPMNDVLKNWKVLLD